MTATEATVMRIWADLLPIVPSTVDDDFFDLGGQSLHLVHFLQRAFEVYGVELSVAELFMDVFSAARTAAAIDSAVAAEAMVTEVLHRLGEVPADEVDVLLPETGQGPSWPRS